MSEYMLSKDYFVQVIRDLIVLKNKEKGIKVYKALVGPFACSMDMAGMSVTLMKLDDELKELMDAPCDTPYFTQK